jgi:hypothetical protein
MEAWQGVVVGPKLVTTMEGLTSSNIDPGTSMEVAGTEAIVQVFYNAEK